MLDFSITHNEEREMQLNIVHWKLPSFFWVVTVTDASDPKDSKESIHFSVWVSLYNQQLYFLRLVMEHNCDNNDRFVGFT